MDGLQGEWSLISYLEARSVPIPLRRGTLPNYLHIIELMLTGISKSAIVATCSIIWCMPLY